MFFAVLISVGGTRTTDQVNQVLTVSMIVLCAYLGSDIRRIRTSVILGNVVPLVGLLVWDAIAHSLSSQADSLIDPVELLMRQRWDGVEIMVQTFSLLAVGTSLIGTLLGFSQFFKEQIVNSFPLQKSIIDLNGMVEKWWISNRIGFTATSMVVGPFLFVSTAVPDVFSAATDIAGGYCMTMLYGVLPPAMAWAMHIGEETDDKKGISRAKPALLGVGLFSSGIILDHFFLDFSNFHS